VIQEFSVENFRSIKEAQTLSFEPDASDHLRENLLSTDARPDVELLSSLFIYGGNGTGKSNLCRALEAFTCLALFSAGHLTLGEKIPDIQPFRLDTKTAERPTCFGMRFLIGENEWDYRVSCDQTRIHDESLRKKANTPKSRWSVIFHRTGTDRSQWIGNAPRLSHSFFQSVRDNSTILSKAAVENIAVVDEVFRAILPISVRSMASPPQTLINELYDFATEYPPILHWLTKIVSCADVVFDSIRFVQEEGSVAGFGASKRDSLGRPNGNVPRILHDLRFARRSLDGALVDFAIEDVSAGTLRFLALTLEIFEATFRGNLLVMDEFDASLHQLLAQEVRNLLLDPLASNQTAGQHILVTHSDSLLDSSRMRRDQIILLDQTPEGATQLYSMSDLDRLPKPDESFQKRYMNGGYGGVPKVGDLRSVFLDMVTEWKMNAS
jgi:hypothetical protein